jgi:hypothetical protein
MKRRIFTTLPFLGLGCASMSDKAESAGGFVVDDAIADVRPKLLLNHDLGSPTFRFKAAFDSLSLQKEVLLGQGGYVKVNGVRLAEDAAEPRGVYVATIDADKTIRIEIFRPSTGVVAFEVALPIFKIVEHPKTYKYPNDLQLVLKPPLAARSTKTIEDRFIATIYRGTSAAFPFSERATVDGENPVVSLKPMFSNTSGAFNDARTRVQRSQRVALRDVTTAYPQGWIVMTVVNQLTIDVVA